MTETSENTGTPDPDLLAATTLRLCYAMRDEFEDETIREYAEMYGRAALATTGEWLRDRLLERAAAYQRAIDAAPRSHPERWEHRRDAIREDADLVARLCGVAPEGSAER